MQSSSATSIIPVAMVADHDDVDVDVDVWLHCVHEPGRKGLLCLR